MCSTSEDPNPGDRVSPSFEGHRPSSAEASRIKQRTRKRDSRPEVALRRALWRLGLRYRLHAAGLPGNPDIVFSRLRTAIFVDGDFWHGRDWENRKQRLSRGANADYWTRKIEYNRARDQRVTEALTAMGWQVLRFWETDIGKDVGRYAGIVAEALAER
jgi:DNA mismatch endonuclease (patch repair protein)